MSKLLRLTIAAAAICALMVVGVANATALPSVHAHAVTAAQPSGKVAFENPETFTGRWVTDHTDFSAALHALDPNIQIIYHNSNANITTQAQNVNADIAAGVKVIVLAAVDQNQDAPLVNKAERAGIKVLAYDRMIQSPVLRAYDSFNNVQVGVEQGSWLAFHVRRGTKAKPTNVIEIRGSSTDHNAALFYQGFQSQMAKVYRTGTVKLGFFKWTPNWDDPTAGQETDQALTLLAGKPLAGVYSMNDAMAATVYASLARHHETGLPLTGQDAQPDGLGRILMHQQGMTVFKNVKLEADSAAQVAYNWVAGKGLPANYTMNCGVGCAQSSGRHVPAALFMPQKITIRNVGAPVAAGYVTWAAVCKSIAKPTKPYCGLRH